MYFVYSAGSNLPKSTNCFWIWRLDFFVLCVFLPRMHLSAQHCHKCESTSNTRTRKPDLLQCLTKETWNWTGLPEAARGAELHNLSVDDIITTYTTRDVIYSQVLHTTHSSLMIDSEVPKKKTAEVLICICCHNGSQMEV